MSNIQAPTSATGKPTNVMTSTAVNAPSGIESAGKIVSEASMTAQPITA